MSGTENLKKEKLKWELRKLEAEAVGVIIRNVMMVLIVIGFIYQGGDLALKSLKFGAEGISVDFAHPRTRSAMAPSPAPEATHSHNRSINVASLSTGSGSISHNGRGMARPVAEAAMGSEAPTPIWGSGNTIVLFLMIIAAIGWVVTNHQKRALPEIKKQEDGKNE